MAVAERTGHAAIRFTGTEQPDTDEYYYVTLFDLWGPAGSIHGQPSRPREAAMTFKRSF